MSSDPIEVLRERLRDYAEGLAAPVTLHAEDVAELTALIRDALASLSAPKPESAEAVAWAVKGPMGETAHMGSVEPDLTEPGWSARPLVYGDTAPPRPEASEGKVLNAAELLQRMGVDGAKWADEFCRTTPGSDWGVMVGWFANAIEAGKAHTAPQQASAPAGVAEAWQEGYRQGVMDERTSEDNIGIAGFGAKVEPARSNPYTLAQQPAAVDEATRRDAERYRYLRRPEAWKEDYMAQRGASPIFIGDGRRGEAKDGEALDAAIDRILAGKQQGGES